MNMKDFMIILDTAYHQVVDGVGGAAAANL